jgi:hypothetical protein
MRPYRWQKTVAFCVLGGVLVGAVVAGVVLWLGSGGTQFDVAPNLQATRGPYRATLERVALQSGGRRGQSWLHAAARIERTDGQPVAVPSAPWPAEDMAAVFDGEGAELSSGQCDVEHSRALDGRAYELRHTWPLRRRPEGALYVTVRFPGEVTPDAAAPLSEGDVETIVQAASGSPAVLVRSVRIAAELAELGEAGGAGQPRPTGAEAGPYLVVVFADAGRIRGPGPMPAIRIAVRDADGQRMDDYSEWVQEARQQVQPPDLCRAYPIATHKAPFTLELTADESYRQGLLEFSFEPIELR